MSEADEQRRSSERRVVFWFIGMLIALALFMGLLAVTWILQGDAQAAVSAPRQVLVCNSGGHSCEWFDYQPRGQHEPAAI